MCFHVELLMYVYRYNVQQFVIIIRLLCDRYSPVGRSFYSPDIRRRQPLGEGLESWRGFYQSIRPTQMGLSLNIGMCFVSFILVLFF